MVGADDIGLDDPHRPGRDARRGPAGAIGAAAPRSRRTSGLTPRGASTASISSATCRARALDVGGEAVVEKGAERIDLVGGDGEPAAIAWPPPATSSPLSFAARSPRRDRRR
jgi:hypothetical protein